MATAVPRTDREPVAEPAPGPVLRTPLVEALADAERRTLDELELARASLQRAAEAAIQGNATAADEVGAAKSEFDRRWSEVHEELLTLIALQSPVATDLRLAMALLHVNDRVERIGAQCVNIATLCSALPDGAEAGQEQLSCLSKMKDLAHHQLGEAARVFAQRDVDGAAALAAGDAAINDQNRRCFQAGIEWASDRDRRQAAFFVAMMARAIERIGDNAVDIGQQAVFVTTGRTRSATGS